MERVLFVCTANICRSPMAERMLAARLSDRGPEVVVTSAGVGGIAGAPAAPGARAVLRARGIDISDHASRLLEAEMLAEADLVLTMERAHLREAAVMEPAAWPRTFTLRELVRRGAELGARAEEESLAVWASRLHTARRSEDVLGASNADDIADPYGGPDEGYEHTARELEVLVMRLEHLAWSSHGA